MGSAQDAAALQNVADDSVSASPDSLAEASDDLDASPDVSADASAAGSADSAEEFSAEAAEAEKHLIGLDELEAIRREAYEMGFQEGQAALAEGGADAAQAIDADATQAGESAESDESAESADEAYLRGIEEGQQQARSELEAEVMLAADDWRELTKSLAVAARDAEAFHQPLLKLSMHLAEQMVRGELTLSGHAITRLVDRALSELQHESAVPIVVRMNPDDLQRFKAYSASIDEQVDVRADPKLMSGSIRVAMNGSMIDDLIEHRRDALWQSLMAAAEGIEDSPPDSFLKNVAMVKEAMEAVDFGADLSAGEQGVVEATPADPTTLDSVLPPDAEPN
jgi:flagellar biosynthesis/type III secretory pathway protein FliH